VTESISSKGLTLPMERRDYKRGLISMTNPFSKGGKNV